MVVGVFLWDLPAELAGRRGARRCTARLPEKLIRGRIRAPTVCSEINNSVSFHEFATGQRWVSNAEPDLGLGLVIDAEERLVQVLFPAADEVRAYAVSGAPLSRLLLTEGDEARSADGWNLTIEEVVDQGGLVIYVGVRTDTGKRAELPETRLAHDLQVNAPRDRLFTNQFDRNSWFELRHDALLNRARLEQSPLRGLLGARISAIPHQLYIAHTVAHRYAPRVLLADEVGLGKTIEAGLILHHQMLTERARRVLIVVPQALISQWVLELLRRFNLDAAIFDEERCAEAESSTGDNPFSSAQLVLCSLDFLLDNPARVEQIHALDWDLMVVDEAHHLRWSEDPGAVSEEYRVVESLARSIPGLMLLTATPEQLGYASHFARLRLLDPDRFESLEQFTEEQKHFVEAAGTVDALLAEGREDEVQQQLDRHGTGRVLFRNTRAHVKGFAERKLHAHALDNPYAHWDLHPEVSADEDWVTWDPRVEWLLNWLRETKNKALVICAHQQTATALEHYLHFQKGIRSAAFHEGLGLLARDRAAAWFAADDGAQALICSEIGSEGRNFQFVQHLILLDLPDQPDLLEQRIGRLDRIGQRDTVHIHLPYLKNSPQELLYRWYDQGLEAFTHFSHAGSQLRAIFADELDAGLSRKDGTDIDALVAATRERHSDIKHDLEQGRDHLLELSSCRQDVAQKLQEQLLASNQDPALAGYLERMCDSFGIEVEPRDDNSLVLRPASGYEEGFKDISTEGTRVTTDRDMALAKEDYTFLSWEHPLITESFDRVLGGHRGNTALGVIQGSAVAPGTLMLECLFQVSVVTPKSLQLGRYLPPQLYRVVIDHKLKFREAELPFDAVRGQAHGVPLSRVKPVLDAQKDVLESMLNAACDHVAPRLDELKAAARQKMDAELQPELDRLRYLKSVNPSVRAVEITHMEQVVEQVAAAVERASISLAGVRILITN